MDAILEVGLAVTRWLQTAYPGLSGFMNALSLLGIFEFYLAALTLIYWSINKRFGKHLTFLLAVSDTFNSMLKSTFRWPRPYWLDSSLGLWEDASYGLPSGHAQSVTVFYGMIAYYVKRTWVWLVAIGLIFLVSLSRVYLGAHFPQDVIAGIGLGLLFLLGYLAWRRYFYERFRNRIMGQRLLAAFSLPVLLGVAFGVLLLILGKPDFSVAWDRSFIEAAELDGYEVVISRLGILLGLGGGFIFEVSRVRFVEAGTWWQRLLRYVGGLTTTLLLLEGLGAILPDDPLWLALPLRFARYTLTGLWVAYYWPWLFVKLGLAESTPQPETRLSVNKDGLLKR